LVYGGKKLEVKGKIIENTVLGEDGKFQGRRVKKNSRRTESGGGGKKNQQLNL